MQSLRLAGGAAIVAATLVGASARACDDRVPATCVAAAHFELPQISQAAALLTPAALRSRSARLAKAERGKKRHGVFHARHRHRAAPPDEQPAEILQPRRMGSPASRRFREFLNPMSFTANPVEELRGPRPNSSHLAGEMTDPQGIAALWTRRGGGDGSAGAEPVVARDDAATEDAGEAPPRMAPGLVAEVRRTAPADRDSGNMWMLRWFFIAWGGILTVASVVRMAVG